MAQKINELEIMMQSIALEDAGKKEEARELLKKIPLKLWQFDVFKKFLGIEWIKQQGYDMSVVEAKYGQSWAMPS
jgi:hypothetical protein